MAAGKAPLTPFQKLAASFEASPRTESRDGRTVEVFGLDREAAVVAVELAHGAAPCLVVRGQEEEAAPSSGYRQNVRTRMRARLVYPVLELKPLTSLDRFNAMFALRIDVRTGDPAFDRAVAIKADLADEVIAQAFGAKEARAAVLEILAAGFNLYFEERALRAELLAPNDSHLTTTTLSPVVAALATLVAHVPRLDPSAITRRPQLGRTLTAVILVVGLVAAGALAPGTFDDAGMAIRPLPRPIVPLPTMIPGILVGSVAFVLAFLGVRWQLKRRNVSTDLPLVLALLVVMATLGVGLLDAANRLLDEAPLATHDAKVIAKDTSKSRKSGLVNEWLLVVPSWQPGATKLELAVDSETHRGIRTGDTVRVSVHPGFFGWEWGAVIERAPGGSAPPGGTTTPDLQDDDRRRPP